MTEQRRLAAIVSSDLVGYSRLMGHDESGTLSILKQVRRDIVDPRIAGHSGRIVKTMGDGLLIEFASAVHAVTCFVDIQRSMASFNATRPAGGRIDFRVGVNVGDIIVDDDDIFGDGVNVAARLQGIAEPGGICMSDFVVQQVRGKVEVELTDLGDVTVKNIDHPVRAWSAAMRNGPAAAAPHPAATGERSSRPSVAVLAFNNIGGDAEMETFCDGLSEDLITALTRFRWMHVTSRTSSFAYKGKSPDVRQVARELGVRYVLEGSVRRAGRRLRANAQLIDAHSGNHVWARRYDREFDDPFDLQDELIRDVAGSIDYTLWHAMARGDGSQPDDVGSPLRAAAWHLLQVTPENDRAGLACCDRALQLNPRSVAAHQYQVFLIVNGLRCGWTADPAAGATAMLGAARHALTLNPGDSLSHGVLAVALLQSGNSEEGLREARQALELNSNSAQTIGVVSGTLMLAGALEQGLSLNERLLDLVPGHYCRAIFLALQGLARWQQGDSERALTLAQGAARLKPAAAIGHLAEAALLADAGRAGEAAQAYARAKSVRPGLDNDGIRQMLSFSASAEKIIAALAALGAPQSVAPPPG